MTNDFEETVFARHPKIAAIKDKLYDEGAIYASMSGSGSSVFGLFREEPSIGQCFCESYILKIP
jgi:4-diphosphocytidyl-2-C-methyl-D-erythritol kinase